MKFDILYRICISLSLVVFAGTVYAHPHEHGELNHGHSLENYQTNFDFTTDSSSKRWRDTDIIFANKNQSENNKSGKSVTTKKLDLQKQKKDYKSQNIKHTKEQKLK